jgi:exopolyphosphatase/guanosine-5'-triphosphate,3'-diphosphate pyrophosphatase
MMSLNDIQADLGLRKDEGSVLLPTIITYLQLMDIVKDDYFSFSRLTFPHTMALYYSGKIKDTHLPSRIKNTLIAIAEKYRANTKHARWVNNFARKFFNELSDLHSLDKSARLILEASIILHDVGRYVSDDALATNSYHIIKSLKIPGLDSRMLLMAAAVVYEGNKTFHEKEPREYSTLTSLERLTIRKLAGIMLISKALDVGGNGHITDIDIQMSDQIIVHANVEREPYLEMYAFDHQKKLFTETFGTAIELRTRVSYD